MPLVYIINHNILTLHKVLFFAYLTRPPYSILKVYFAVLVFCCCLFFLDNFQSEVMGSESDDNP